MYNVHTYISYVTGKKTPENVNPTENAKMNQKLKEYIYIYIYTFLLIYFYFNLYFSSVPERVSVEYSKSRLSTDTKTA